MYERPAIDASAPRLGQTQRGKDEKQTPIDDTAYRSEPLQDPGNALGQTQGDKDKKQKPVDDTAHRSEPMQEPGSAFRAVPKFA